jgi:DNA polymerase (family X)
MTKEEVAAILEEIGTLLELKGENPFKCNAYRNGARAVQQLPGDLEELVRDGKLVGAPGIGDSLREKITTLVRQGSLPFYDELKASIPEALVRMLKIPGMGPKKVIALHNDLGISTLEELRSACSTGRVAKLKGFGEKTQHKILEGLAFIDEIGNRVRIDQALPVALEMLSALRSNPHVIRAELCGSLRRRRETTKDIDLLVSTGNADKVRETFASLPHVKKVIAHGPTKSSLIVEHFAENAKVTLGSDIRVVTDQQFPFALNYFTGSKDHNIRLRQRAIDRGLKLNEYELVGEKRNVQCKDENEIYATLEVDWMPPEMREDTGEIDLAAWENGRSKNRLPKLVEARDIRGVFHNHSKWSDGAATLEQMAQAAKKLGYEYFGIGDHSPSLTIANGLSSERVRQQHAEIDGLNKKLKGIRIFKGAEVDILEDGSLDYDNKVLESFEYVVASVHTLFGMPEEQMTQRIVRAVKHPLVTMLGHATGRLLLRRDGYKVNLDKVLEACAGAGTMIEINAQPLRLDLDWKYCKRAKSLGIKLVINPDAHSTAELGLVPYGVDVARRAWLEAADVLNTQALKQVCKSLEIE